MEKSFRKVRTISNGISNDFLVASLFVSCSPCSKVVRKWWQSDEREFPKAEEYTSREKGKEWPPILEFLSSSGRLPKPSNSQAALHPDVD